MSKHEHRFQLIHKEGSSLTDGGQKQLIVDKETGVTYLVVNSGYGEGITPLLNADGKPIITRL